MSPRAVCSGSRSVERCSAGCNESPAVPMPEIKIAQIIEATTGGTRRHVVDVSRHLNSAVFSVSLICSTRRDIHFSERYPAPVAERDCGL